MPQWTLDALLHGGPYGWSSDHHHHHRHRHHWHRTNWSLLSCLVVWTVLVEIGSPPSGSITVTAHQPPRSPTAQQLALATLAHQLMKARLGSSAKSNAYYYDHLSPSASSSQGRLRAQLLTNHHNHHHPQQQQQQQQQQLSTSPNESKAALLAAQHDPWAYYYYYKQQHGSVPSCADLRHLWKLNQLGTGRNAEAAKVSSGQLDLAAVETEEEREKLRRLAQIVPRARQVYITGIVPGTKQVQARNEEATEPPQPTSSPYGIIHASPYDLGRTTVSTRDRQLGPESGVFGEFLDNLPKQDHDRYLSGYNLRNGKQGIKAFKESNPSNNNNNNNSSNMQNSSGSSNKEGGNGARRRPPLPATGAGSPSGSRLREFNSPRFPGVWHNKPVKPSVQIL